MGKWHFWGQKGVKKGQKWSKNGLFSVSPPYPPFHLRDIDGENTPKNGKNGVFGGFFRGVEKWPF
jgi:hypothetical protein